MLTAAFRTGRFLYRSGQSIVNYCTATRPVRRGDYTLAPQNNNTDATDSADIEMGTPERQDSDEKQQGDNLAETVTNSSLPPELQITQSSTEIANLNREQQQAEDAINQLYLRPCPEIGIGVFAGLEIGSIIILTHFHLLAPGIIIGVLCLPFDSLYIYVDVAREKTNSNNEIFRKLNINPLTDSRSEAETKMQQAHQTRLRDTQKKIKFEVAFNQRVFSFFKPNGSNSNLPTKMIKTILDYAGTTASDTKDGEVSHVAMSVGYGPTSSTT